MNHRLEYFALLLLLFKYSFSEEPKIKRCVRGYELSFFYSKKKNKDAKQACQIYGNSSLVKVDNADITTVIDSVIIYKDPYPFYIDGHADDNRTFTWSDGSNVNRRNRGGYQNWAQDQPNNFNHNEDCIIVGREGNQWKDSGCNELLNYICQKDKDPCITVNSATPYVHICIATGSIEPHVEWRRDGNVVSNTSDQTIYQTKDQGIATLYYKNATIDDAGEYLCVARTNISNQFSAPEQIKVNGTPLIINIVSFKCNSSLLITWKSSLSALGFPHRIILLSNETAANLFITPTVESEYFTEITKLQSTTKYNVQITACSKKDKCPVDYAVHRDATTNGIIKSVINASMEQLGGNKTCIVSWEWPHITPEDNVTQFKIIILSDSTATSSNEDIRFVNITTSNYSYSFEPQPSETYNVDIQSIESVESCKTVRAFGSCVGKDATIQSSSTTIIIIILPGAGGVSILIVVVLLVRKRRNKALNESAVIMDITVSTERKEESAPTGIERTNELYVMAFEVESTSSAPIYATVNKERFL